jgi:hypothetical protein
MVPAQLIALPTAFGKHLRETDAGIDGIPCISLWLFV